MRRDTRARGGLVAFGPRNERVAEMARMLRQSKVPLEVGGPIPSHRGSLFDPKLARRMGREPTLSRDQRMVDVATMRGVDVVKPFLAAPCTFTVETPQTGYCRGVESQDYTA